MEPHAGEEVTQWMTADEVADRLNIKRETVYAYVSRGRLTSRRSADGRGSVFAAVDVERLAARVKGSARTGSGATESEITLISDGQLFYRGISAQELARTRSFEATAELLWGTEGGRGFAWEPASTTEQLARGIADLLPPTTLPVDHLKVIASFIGALEPAGWESHPNVVAASARRLLTTMIAALPQQSEPLEWTDGPTAGRLAPLLWSRLCAREPTVAELRALNTAMVLNADHDLASATVVVRTAARAGVDPGGLVRLGLDVGSGPVKGAAGLAIEAFLRDLDSPSHVELALAKRLRQGEPIPGFGHVMYPDGDPRASAVLDCLRAADVDAQRLETVEELIVRQTRRGLPPPNAGFALSALTYVTDMVPGAGEAIFVVSRSAGWIAHGLEEYGGDPAPRQHSLYVGPPPA